MALARSAALLRVSEELFFFMPMYAVCYYKTMLDDVVNYDSEG